ncbi:hypothetical protein HAX54_000932 [Datura stramonium]|uniref:Uncharacterized protein n=1 Tax=Datura stramonium TaxID=4076 RepID=A0ABS8WUB1_DATST|nr:hypothetical protein [Datura stramonium]
MRFAGALLRLADLLSGLTSDPFMFSALAYAIRKYKSAARRSGSPNLHVQHASREVSSGVRSELVFSLTQQGLQAISILSTIWLFQILHSRGEVGARL